MAARTRERGPQQNRRDAFRVRHRSWVERAAFTVAHRALTAKLRVPDPHLAREVPETADGDQIMTRSRRTGAHRKKGFDGRPMQCARRLRNVDHMRAGAARQLERIHGSGVISPLCDSPEP
jgi:hypothetical protein